MGTLFGASGEQLFAAAFLIAAPFRFSAMVSHLKRGLSLSS